MKVLNTNTSRSGFTLIEVLIAMTLGIALISAVTLFMGDTAILYTRERTAPAPMQHGETLARFLAHTLATAKSVQENNSANILSWQKLPNASPASKPLLSFRTSETLPPLENGGLPNLERICFLEHESDVGLVLLWYPAFNSDPPEETIRRTLLSPHVQNLTYRYFDKENEEWANFDTFSDEKTRPLPGIIELSILVKESKTRTFAIPISSTSSDGAPLY